MSINYYLYLDTPVSSASMRRWLIDVYNFQTSTTWLARGGTSWLISKRGDVLIEPPDPDLGGPYKYKQSKTLDVILDLNNREGASEFLLRIAGDILQHCLGDATIEYDVGSTLLLRRGKTVWIDNDPFNRKHLFAGDFRPTKLVVGLPPPDLDLVGHTASE